MANSRLARGALKARLWEISWMDRKRFWFAVAPMMYAVRKNCRESMGVSLRCMAQVTWSKSTRRTRYLVKGSGPQSFVTYHA